MEEEERERKAKRQERIDSVMKVTLPRQGCPAGLQLWWGVNMFCLLVWGPLLYPAEEHAREGEKRGRAYSYANTSLPFRAQYSTETKVRARAREPLFSGGFLREVPMRGVDSNKNIRSAVMSPAP